MWYPDEQQDYLAKAQVVLTIAKSIFCVLVGLASLIFAW